MISQIVQGLDRLSDCLGRAIAWLTLAMVLLTIVVVVLRYVFEIGAIALQESVMYLHGIVFLLGIPFALKEDSHVRVDIFYSRMTANQRRVVNTTGHLLFLLPVSLTILVLSWPYTLAAWRVFEGSAEVGGIPAVFLLKTLIPVMAILLLLQGISELLKLLLARRQGIS